MNERINAENFMYSFMSVSSSANKWFKENDM